MGGKNRRLPGDPWPCACGCGSLLWPQTGHRYMGVPQYRRGHHLNAARTTEERFWKYVQKQDRCWEWAGVGRVAGYGRLRVSGGNKVLAHRFSWELHRGTIPDGLFVCHHCDNRLCVRPEHLFLGTAQDNVDDMMAKGRGVESRGEANGNSKLTRAQVEDIRMRRARGEKRIDLAREFGVRPENVSLITAKKIWA